MISTLSLLHYKNYSNTSVSFSPGLNFVVGQNGMGKTNLLDAIYYLCMAKSHSTPLDRDTVSFGQEFFRLEAEVFARQESHALCVKVKPGETKDIAVDGVSAVKLSEYVGFLPVIMLAPEDIILIQGGSASRRRFMDVVLCQANREYLDHLQRYNRLLSQRNALLRSDGFHADRILLRTYSRSMKDSAHFIFTERSRLSQKLLPAVMEYYAILSSAKEKPSLQYLSQISEYDFEKIAEASIESDIQNGRTTKGVHKDDLDILLDERQVKRFGSQGQIKSLLIAMHLAQLSFLRKELDSTPVLLLDDIFDRLDEQRAHQLISILTSDHVDQVFISDASPRRVHELMSAGIADAQIVYVQDGTVLSVSDMGDDRENANLQHDDEEE